jgi:ABC-type sugar transport system ATPase subunit
MDGAPVAFAGPRDAHARGIRVIHQEPEIVPHMSVGENIYVGQLPRRAGILLDGGRLAGQTASLLAEFGMAEELAHDQRCDGLGPAQRQMIEIMRAVHAGGRLIAFDEPTSSLTDAEARRLFGTIRRLRADGAAIVYISHRLPRSSTSPTGSPCCATGGWPTLGPPPVRPRPASPARWWDATCRRCSRLARHAPSASFSRSRD